MMRKLLASAQNLPEYTQKQLTTVLTTLTLVAQQKKLAPGEEKLNPELGEALFPIVTVTDPVVANTVKATETLFSDFFEFHTHVRKAWDQVQQKKDAKKTDYATEELISIYQNLLPAEIPSETYLTISKKLECLMDQLNEVDASIKMTFTEIVVVLKSAIDFKLRSSNSLPNSISAGDLHIDRTETSPVEENDSESEEQLLSSPSISQHHVEETQDVKGTIAILETDFNELEEKEEPKKNSSEIAEIIEAMQAIGFIQRSAIQLKNQMLEEIKKYKSTLSEYIINKLKTASDLHSHFVENKQEDAECKVPVYEIDEKTNAIAHDENGKDKVVASLVMASNNEDNSEFGKKAKIFIENSPNLTRAVENYRFINLLEEELNPTRKNDANILLPRVTKRLLDIGNKYRNIDKSLQKVGDEAVDKVTRGFLGFFKRLCSTIKRFFSSVAKVERNFTKTINKCRSQFFKMVGELPPEKELEQIQKQERNNTRITRQVV